MGEPIYNTERYKYTKHDVKTASGKRAAVDNGDPLSEALRGKDAEAVVPKIIKAVESYPYRNYGDYRIWPGPNSNTFVATVMRAAPELQGTLPPTAIGKDFRADGSVFGLTPSGTGVEIEIFGLFGIKVGWIEGIEFNLFTLVAGLDIRHPAVKLPGIGRIGFDKPPPAQIH